MSNSLIVRLIVPQVLYYANIKRYGKVVVNRVRPLACSPAEEQLQLGSTGESTQPRVGRGRLRGLRALFTRRSLGAPSSARDWRQRQLATQQTFVKQQPLTIQQMITCLGWLVAKPG